MKTLAVLAACALLAFPALAHANACVAGSLDTILALPNATCTIAGTTFAFNHPLNGIPEYFSGPWAGEGTWGPASNITFTPDASDPTNPGFTLSGNFHAAYALYDIQLGYFLVTAPTGDNVDAYSIAMNNPVFNTTDAYASDVVFLNALAVTQATPSASSLSYIIANSVYGSIDLRFWNHYGGDVGFDSATFHWNEVPVQAPVPEPGSLLLVGTGLFSVLGFLRRKLSRLLISAS